MKNKRNFFNVPTSNLGSYLKSLGYINIKTCAYFWAYNHWVVINEFFADLSVSFQTPFSIQSLKMLSEKAKDWVVPGK